MKNLRNRPKAPNAKTTVHSYKMHYIQWPKLSYKNLFSYLLKCNVGEPTPDTLDGGNGEHGVPLTLQVRVHHTKDVLEVVW